MPQRLDRASVPLISLCCQGIARLKPDLSLAQASADVDRMIPMAPARFRLNPGASATGYKNARIGPNSRFLKDELVGDIGRTRLARAFCSKARCSALPEVRSARRATRIDPVEALRVE